NVEEMGGLYVIATERHESRRIDNQLRGRSGRQGDNGASRFFLSMEDDLMKMFAGETTLRVLSKLGMKEGDAIEHPMLTKSVGRAQRKVEERNFLIRKNILEYDEVMDVQRKEFYGMRQDVLEGVGVKELIFEHIDESVRDAVYTYLDPSHAANCIAEWVRENMGAAIDPDRMRGKDREDLHRLIVRDAHEEAGNIIRVTIGEYLTEAIDLGTGETTEVTPESWDYKGLADWANATFKAGVTMSELRDLSRDEIIERLEKAAGVQIENTDLAPLDQYLVKGYGAAELARWAGNKLAREFKPEDFKQYEDLEKATEWLMDQAARAYADREVSYPIDFAIDMTTAGMQNDPAQAVTQFCAWAKARYELDWTPETLPSQKPVELMEILKTEAKTWDKARISGRARRIVEEAKSPAEMDAWFQANCFIRLSEEELEQAKSDALAVANEKLQTLLRQELSQFERWVLLQILDQAWKDHLYAMDQLRESIGLRSFSQRDPRIEYKREGAKLFEDMYQSIRDKVTDLIFKAKLTPQAAPRAQTPGQSQMHATQSGVSEAQPVGAGAGGGPAPVRAAQPAYAAAAAAAAAAGTARQQADLEAAQRASRGGPAAKQKRKPIKAAPTVGRNEPCPCGSGKKYKQCCARKA
ncbi:MAG: preprotein translocase subunit SecA, partial [Planctomycetota bacterium]